MAQQKSEDRVVPEGGVMPVERVGSSPGGQGKAVPVEETAVQLSLAIATAENSQGATLAGPGVVLAGGDTGQVEALGSRSASSQSLEPPISACGGGSRRLEDVTPAIVVCFRVFGSVAVCRSVRKLAVDHRGLGRGDLLMLVQRVCA
jgi:hypothetical protein